MTPDEFLTEATRAIKAAKTDRDLTVAVDRWLSGELWKCQPEFIKEELRDLHFRQIGWVYGVHAG